MFKTAIVTSAASTFFSQFLPLNYAFILGGLFILIPLRLTIMPGNFPSNSGMVASGLAIVGVMMGLTPLFSFILGVTGGTLYLYFIVALLFGGLKLRNA